MVQNQNSYVEIEWLLYNIRSQIDQLAWMAVKMDSDNAIHEELSEVQKNLDEVKSLLNPRSDFLEKNDYYCIAMGL